LDDFKAIVEDAHSRGMKVIIDWVANHSAWDNVWVEEGHTDWYTLDSIGGLQPPIGTDWWDVADLNYENEDMRKRMISSMAFWLEEVDIDGFRCDVAEWVPDDFWNEARAELDKVKDVYMLAEAEHVEHHEKAFDASYAWEWHFIMNDVAQGKKGVKEVRAYLEKEKRFPAESHRLNMTSNHDENTWKGTVKERLGKGVQTTAVLSATLFGMPLIYSGQEASLDHRLEFFEKDEIDWTEIPLSGFYKRLVEINHENEALWNGVDGDYTPTIVSNDVDENVVAYYREKNKEAVLVLLNFSDVPQNVSVDTKDIEGYYEELFTGDELDLEGDYTEVLLPWGYRVYEIRH
jgi:glycosidase